MITGYDIICFANDWDSDPLSKKHVMTRLARRNRVLWVNSIGNRNPRASARDLGRMLGKLRQFFEGCRDAGGGIQVFSPLAIPFHGNAAARRFNRAFLRWTIRRAARNLGFRRVMTYSFLPSSADIVGHLGEEMVVYHCTDDFTEFTGTNALNILEMERRLIEKADCVIASAERLYEARREWNPETHLVRHGVEVDHFRQACRPDLPIPADIAQLRGPVIGFFGLIADWVDLNLVRRLAKDRPKWQFVLIGKIDTDVSSLTGIGNVHLLGRRSYADLPAYARGFDAAILPFVVNRLTLAANPLKLREYLAAGLPVVSTDIPEARRLGDYLHVADTYGTFRNRLDGIIGAGRTGPTLDISRTMDAESWDQKVDEISRIVSNLGSRRLNERTALREPAAA